LSGDIQKIGIQSVGIRPVGIRSVDIPPCHRIFPLGKFFGESSSSAAVVAVVVHDVCAYVPTFNKLCTVAGSKECSRQAEKVC
jgi:hypothetical protein